MGKPSGTTTAFEELAEIIGWKHAHKLIELMPGRVVKIRKKHYNVSRLYLGDSSILALPIIEAAEILGCRRKYLNRLKMQINGKRR